MSKLPFSHNKKQIYWVLTDSCNYRCKYCFTQNKKESSVSSLAIVDGFARKFRKLKGKWDFVLSGGEPFKCKKFFEIVKKLIEINQVGRISVYTKFSTKPEDIIKFLKIAKGRLGIFYASLHLDHARPKDFLDKILYIEKKIPGFKKNVFVHSVGTVKDLQAMEKIKKMFFDSGIQFFVLAQLLPELKSISYTEKQKKLLKEISKIYNLPNFYDYSIARCNYGISSTDFKGKKCSAGSKNFFVSPLGDVYSCLSASRAKKDYLGNISSDFEPKNKIEGCQYDQCFLPANYEQYFWSTKN